MSNANGSTSNIKLKAREIRDSRGRPTVAVELSIGNVTTTGDVPAGASKGQDEAQTVPVERAIRNINEVLLPLIRESDSDLTYHADLMSLEQLMSQAAGVNFRELGANATLPVSRALWKAAAALRGKELYQYVREVEPELAGDGQGVQFLMNIFNGGLHALRDGEKLGVDRFDIQEIMVVPQANSYAQALSMGEAIDAALKKLLVDKFGAEQVSRADEAGFSVKGLGDSREALGYVFEAIKSAGYIPGDDVKLALDVAASSFYDKEKKAYVVQGKELDTDAMVNYLVELVDGYKGLFVSIEDGLDENDWDGWKKLTQAMDERGVVTVGDDLFVTQMPRLKKGVAADSARAILIKVNQNGTMHGTLQVMKYARRHGMKCIVSHRSGETLDPSIADLAYATGSMGLKTGDPQPEEDFPDESTWVRRVKYLRMVQIEGDRKKKGGRGGNREGRGGRSDREGRGKQGGSEARAS